MNCESTRQKVGQEGVTTAEERDNFGPLAGTKFSMLEKEELFEKAPLSFRRQFSASFLSTVLFAAFVSCT